MQKCPHRVHKTVDTLEFSSREEFERYLLVGKYPAHSSPCVEYDLNDQESLEPAHSLVYEEWHKQDTRIDGFGRCNVRYRCRRHRRCKEKRRESPKESVGCGCTAKLQAIFNTDGSVSVTFRSKHNHRTQGGQALEYVNPIQVCRQIREMVDERLYAGITKTGKIRSN